MLFFIFKNLIFNFYIILLNKTRRKYKKMSKKATLKYSVFVLTIILSLFFCITNVLATDTPTSKASEKAQTLGDLAAGEQKTLDEADCKKQGYTEDYVPPTVGELYTNTNGTLGLELEFTMDGLTEVEENM